MRAEAMISNWYEVQRNLFTSVIREYIVNNLMSACPNHLPQKLLIVNA